MRWMSGSAAEEERVEFWGSFSDVVDVQLEGKGRVHVDAKVLCQKGGSY